MVYGYNRVSSKEQHLDRGNINIVNFCETQGWHLEKIYWDKSTGRNYNRARYLVLKEDVLRPGDIVVIPEYDRIGRADETKKELEYFGSRDIRVVFLDIPTSQIDLSNISDEMAKMMLKWLNNVLIDIFDLMARTELSKREKRQREGIAAKKARGEWEDYGRPRVKKPENWDETIALVNIKKITAVEAMKRLNMKKTTFYKLWKDEKERGTENGNDR